MSEAKGKDLNRKSKLECFVNKYCLVDFLKTRGTFLQRIEKVRQMSQTAYLEVLVLPNQEHSVKLKSRILRRIKMKEAVQRTRCNSKYR